MYSAPLRLGAFTQYGLFRISADGSRHEVRSATLLWPLNFQRLQAQARQPERMQERMRDYARRWPLAAGERLQLRKQRVRLERDGEQLRVQVFSSRVEFEVGAP
ncbi:MAG: hypothetical protein KF760_18890 [Candidatus Eremiobacteraeota bacterium]|nr:hypothetical protein [Candidatus Eremiobacteraeota bacterium]MCW5868466.1 hypothetical protein [Candidatus Eremiobacteraeota bacterium]